jgi:hypothetical protein
VRPETPPVPETTLLLGLILCGVAVCVCVIEFFTK